MEQKNQINGKLCPSGNQHLLISLGTVTVDIPGIRFSNPDMVSLTKYPGNMAFPQSRDPTESLSPHLRGLEWNKLFSFPGIFLPAAELWMMPQKQMKFSNWLTGEKYADTSPMNVFNAKASNDFHCSCGFITTTTILAVKNLVLY